eukprot:358855-Chlamydomonas_euryale.AAC.3
MADARTSRGTHAAATADTAGMPTADAKPKLARVASSAANEEPPKPPTTLVPPAPAAMVAAVVSADTAAKTALVASRDTDHTSRLGSSTLWAQRGSAAAPCGSSVLSKEERGGGERGGSVGGGEGRRGEERGEKRGGEVWGKGI